MNRYRFVLALALALVIVVGAFGIHPVSSATMGTLYITPNDVNLASGTVTYKIFADSIGASTTSGINAWNLIVDDHDAASTSLTPVSISIAGNLLAPFGQVTEIINCVNGGTPGGLPGPGNSGCDVQDGPGIVHTAAVLNGPATPTSISGLIATITYTALSSSPTTLGFVSTPSEGDLLTDGSSTPVPHTTRGASFATISPDFVITATDSPAFNPGGTGSSTVTLTGLNGFTSSVSLTHTQYPPTGLTVNCPASGTPSASGATVNCTFSSTTPGAYVVTLTGTSGSTVHLAPINVNVGDFSLGNPVPSPVKFNSGSTGTTKIIVRSVNGFSGSVAFSATTTPTTGLAVDCGAPVTVSPILSPTVTCTFSSSTPATYSVIITGTFSITGGGTVAHTKSVSVTVMVPTDFTISPSAAVIVQATVGTAATQTITVGAVNGFTGTVSLAVNTPLPAGLTCSPIPSVTLPGATTATLSCTASAAGDFPVSVKGTSGTLTHSTATITFHAVAVTPPDFTISPTAATTVQATVGTPASQTITLAATNGFTGTVSLATNTLPTGLGCSPISSVTLPGATTATLSCTASTAGDFPVTVTGTSGSLSHSTGTITFHAVPAAPPPDFTIGPSAPVTVQATVGIPATQTITLAVVNGFTGTVALSVNTPLPVGLTCNPIPSVTLPAATTATLSCTASSAGDFAVTVKGTSGTLSHSTGTITFHAVAVIPPDFTISPTTAVTVQATVGTAATQTITLAATNGFTGTVALSINTPLPTGLSCSPISSVTLPATTTATLSCTASAPGNFPVTVTGMSGTLSHSTAVITFHAIGAPDFTISPTSATTVQATVGTAATQTITFVATNGFTGTVALSTNTPLPAGLTCSPISSVTLPGTTTATLSCTASTAGDFPVIVTGTSGTLVHATGMITFHAVAVGVLSLIASPNPVNTNVNVAGISTITVHAPTGTTGTVVFQVTPSTGLTCDPLASVTLPGTTTATLSCTAAVAADYTAGIVGSVGSLTSSALIVNFHVTQPVVQTLSLSANPNPVSATVNVVATSQITVTATGGLIGAVTFTVTPQTGLVCPAIPSITLPIVSTATLSCTAAAAGSFTAQVKAAVGTVASPMITVTFNVAMPDFDIVSSSTGLSCSPGGTAMSTISITPKNGFTGTVALTATAPNGFTATFNPTDIFGTTTSTLTVQCSLTAPIGTSTITVHGTSSPNLSHSINIGVVVIGAPRFIIAANPMSVTCNVGDTSKTSTISATGENGFTGTAALSVQSSASGVATGTLSSSTITVGVGSVTLNVNCVAQGSATFTVTGNGGGVISSATVTVTVNQPVAVSFSITSTVNSLSCIAGSNAPMSTITITGDTGFEGVVMLSTTVSPNNGGITATLSNLQVTGSGTSMLSVHCVTAGTYTINVQGQSGLTIEHAPLIIVTVTPVQVTGDFTVTAKPDNVTVEQGDKAKSIITVTGKNSFTGTVNLSATVSCSNVHADLSKLHLVIQKDSSNHTRLVISADASASLGTCTVTITGVSGSLSHSATVKVTVVAEEKNECVGTGDDDNGHHETGDDKTAGKDRDDDECMEEGRGHECKGNDSNGLGDDKDARDKMMKTRDDCDTTCHSDSESVEGAEHEGSKNDCATSSTHGTDHDDNNTSSIVKGSRDNDVKNVQGEALVSLTDSDRRIC